MRRAGQFASTRRTSVVLSYFNSCNRETITGGLVTVGTNYSDVQLGKVERTVTPCDAGRMQLTAQLRSQSTGSVFRNVADRPTEMLARPLPQFILYGASPIVEINGGGTLEIERIDQRGEHYLLNIDPQQLVRGVFYDFDRAGEALSAGGTYRASLGEQQLIFAVAPFAKGGQTPIIGRLLRFAPVEKTP